MYKLSPRHSAGSLGIEAEPEHIAASARSGTGCEATTRYGWNVGLGTKLFVLGFRSFLEARYHRTERGDANVHFFPVTFGFLFSWTDSIVYGLQRQHHSGHPSSKGERGCGGTG